MSKPNTGQIATSAKMGLLKLPDGKLKYLLYWLYLKFLKSIRHISPDSRLDDETKKKGNLDRIKSSNEKRIKDPTSLSISLRKLKFPFLTGVEYFDKHTKLIAGQKLEKLLQVIPQETMALLTDLETPYPFESELPQHLVVSAPELKQVTEETLNFELKLLSKPVLSALFALLTKTDITPVHTLCDNQRFAGCFEGFCERVQQMTSGEIPANQDTHFAAQHCRNHHGCPNCRALCAMMTILRYPSNPNIGKQISRCVWQGSIFAGLAMRHFCLLTCGATSALAQVVNDPESPHREMLIQLLTEMGVQETPEEKRLREQQDAADRLIELAKFKDHNQIERVMIAEQLRSDAFMYGLGYYP